MPLRPPPTMLPPAAALPSSGAWAWAWVAPAAPRTITEANSASRNMVSDLLGRGTVRAKEVPGGPAVAQEDGRTHRPGPTQRADLGHPRRGCAPGPGRPAGARWGARASDR